MRIHHQSGITPLLALVNATAEWHAGLPGSCSASVRLLDRVHFTVYRGDCVVVHHDDPASARVLLAALGGHEALPVQRRLQGQRHCAPGVRIRRCSIPVAAVQALQSGWQQLTGGDDTSAVDRVTAEAAMPDAVMPDPVVHLMRASRHGRLSAGERTQWSGWAARARARGGALVIVAPGILRPAPADRTPPRPHAAAVTASATAAAITGTLREHAAGVYGPDAPPSHTQVNTHALWLHHGRLCNLRTWE